MECVFNRHSKFENSFKKQERNFCLWGNDRLMESDQFRKCDMVESEGQDCQVGKETSLISKK